LGSLRTFEAAGRLLSFTKAAGEIGVTPAAVSHQMKELEEQLGARLFERRSPGLRLTAAGEIFHTAVSKSVDTLSQAVARLRRPESRPRLMVTASPSIAAKWLVPRLDGFLRVVPDADVRIDVSTELLDFARDDIDVAIRFGDGNYPSLDVQRLFEETVFPVCSPKLLTGTPSLKRPEDLLQHTLIYDDWQGQSATWPNWKMWLLAAGLRDIDNVRSIHFTHTALALQAAIDGQGVALTESTLVADDLAKGLLVQPFSMALRGPPQFAYYALTLPDQRPDSLVCRFRSWLIEEAAKTKTAISR
jgi:LysR family transcriptional regulator, glycine cleavage system transcriptional activator